MVWPSHWNASSNHRSTGADREAGYFYSGFARSYDLHEEDSSAAVYTAWKLVIKKADHVVNELDANANADCQ